VGWRGTANILSGHCPGRFCRHSKESKPGARRDPTVRIATIHALAQVNATLTVRYHRRALDGKNTCILLTFRVFRNGRATALHAAATLFIRRRIVRSSFTNEHVADTPDPTEPFPVLEFPGDSVAGSIHFARSRTAGDHRVTHGPPDEFGVRAGFELRPS
jgi:hypothetical protein